MASTPEAARRDALDRRGDFKRWVYLLVRMVCWVPIRIVFRLRVVGLDGVPATGGAIVAPTHRSNFDSVVVGVALHRHLRFMAKAELYRSRPFAWLRAHVGLTDEEADALAAAVLADVDEATRLAEASPWPDPATVTDGVYA